MSTNPYKSFVGFKILPADYTWLSQYMAGMYAEEEIEPYMARDPSGQSWRAIGIGRTLDEEIGRDLDGVGALMGVQFNERVLPGNVRDNLMKAKVAKLEAQTGKKVSKKEYAQLRDEAESDLLPKAFIRRTTVPVMLVAPDLLLICSSSPKKCDDIVYVISRMFNDLAKRELKVYPFDCNTELGTWLNGVARDTADQPSSGDLYFLSTNAAVLKGENKRTIRIKDRDIESGEIQALLKEDYQVKELGLTLTDDDGPALNFSVNDQYVFKGAAIPDVQATRLKDDSHGYAVLCAQTYRLVLKNLFDALGGLKPLPTEEDDDEI